MSSERTVLSTSNLNQDLRNSNLFEIERTNMENVDNAMETEIDAVTDEYGEQTPSLSQEKALLKEPMEGIETNNPQRVSNSTGDGTDANNPPWNKETPIPNANIDPNEQQATPKASGTVRSRKTSFGTTGTVPSDQSASTVEVANSTKRRQRKRPSGAQVMKRRRLAKELKALQQQQQQNGSGRTEMGSPDS